MNTFTINSGGYSDIGLLVSPDEISKLKREIFMGGDFYRDYEVTLVIKRRN